MHRPSSPALAKQQQGGWGDPGLELGVFRPSQSRRGGSAAPPEIDTDGGVFRPSQYSKGSAADTWTTQHSKGGAVDAVTSQYSKGGAADAVTLEVQPLLQLSRHTSSLLLGAGYPSSSNKLEGLDGSGHISVVPDPLWLSPEGAGKGGHVQALDDNEDDEKVGPTRLFYLF